jgi:hypothetical protein
LRSGHAGGTGRFGFANENTGAIAAGEFEYWSDEVYDVYEVTRIRIISDQYGAYRAREEYDIGRLAKLFRAKSDLLSSTQRPEVLVVDSRPATLAEIDQKSGKRNGSK